VGSSSRLPQEVIRTTLSGAGRASLPAICFDKGRGQGRPHHGPDFLALGNRLTDADIGIEYNGTTSGKYRDNLTSAITTPFVGGTAAGGNN